MIPLTYNTRGTIQYHSYRNNNIAHMLEKHFCFPQFPSIFITRCKAYILDPYITLNDQIMHFSLQYQRKASILSLPPASLLFMHKSSFHWFFVITMFSLLHIYSHCLTMTCRYKCNASKCIFSSFNCIWSDQSACKCR